MTQLARPLRPTLADRWQAGTVALRPNSESAPEQVDAVRALDEQPGR